MANPTVKGDIQINGKDYLIAPRGYSFTESLRTRPNPTTEPRSLSTLEHQNNWAYMGQTEFYGMGFPNKLGDGPFKDAYGIDISGTDAHLKVAKNLTLDQADAVNVDGYVGFRIGYPKGDPNYGHDRVIFVGKTDGKSWSKDCQTGIWTGTASALGAGVKAVSHGFFNRTTFVGASNGHIFQTDDGITYTDKGVVAGAPATNCYILGVLKGAMYFGYSDGSLYSMDTGGSFVNLVPAGSIGGTPVCGAAGANVLYILTEGPSPQVLFTDGTSLFQNTIIGTDFNPRAAVFLGKLFIFGDQSFGTTKKGAIWTLSANGLAEELSFGDNTEDQSILSAHIEGEQILWTATGNAATGKSGIGVWDPKLDRSPDIFLGFYVSNVTDYSAGKRVHGVTTGLGVRYAGVEGVGIYKEGSYSTFKLWMGLFGADQRNIRKLWGSAEVHHSTLAAGQTVTISTTKKPTDAPTVWGSSSTAGKDSATLPTPGGGYFTPFLSVIISGDAAGAALDIYDVALSYIKVPDTVKLEWRIGVAISGHDGFNDNGEWVPAQRQVMRDGTDNTRTSIQMITELKAILNSVVTFQDLDGSEHTVIVKAPSGYPDADGNPRAQELDRRVDAAGVSVANLTETFNLYLVEL